MAQAVHDLDRDSLEGPQTYPTRLSFSYDQDRQAAADDALGQIHLASTIEKKRLWWRHAAVNALFIASWYVPLYQYN